MISARGRRLWAAREGGPQLLDTLSSSAVRAWRAIAFAQALAAFPSGAGAVPDAYQLVWSDEFDRLSLGEPDQGHNWSPYYTGWNVRRLEGNDDEAVKTADAQRLVGGGTVGEALRSTERWGTRVGYLHEVRGGHLALRGYPVPDGQRAAFWHAPYIAGMISG